MNNIVNMVNYYIEHKNADGNVIEYIKNKIHGSSIEDLIIIQIELLYTDPSDKLVSELVSYINDIINKSLKEISLYDLASLIGLLHHKKSEIEYEIEDLEILNKEIFEKIKNKDFNDIRNHNETDNDVAARLIDTTQNNLFYINKNKSEINSIGIWLNNLDNSYKKKINNTEIKELLNSYINILTLINRDNFINEYIFKLSNKIDSILLDRNILNLITNVMPELDKIYKENSNERNHLYKLLDYYIDLVDMHIKRVINKMYYEERLLLKDKINLICKEIKENDDPDDDFKILVISSYLRYL